MVATARNPASLNGLGVTKVRFDVLSQDDLHELGLWITPDTRVLYSLPSIGEIDLTLTVLQALGTVARIVYLSTTGVYGRQRDIDETSRTLAETSRERLRVEAEQAIAGFVQNALILRPAAIYGPHRGVHSAIRAGTYRLTADGANFVSRIHVDDLATHCVAGLLSDVTGSWPVGDEHPCTSREIAEFCSGLLQTSLPAEVAPEALSETRRADRRVDGSGIRRQLRVELRYPSYRVGIPACIEEEAAELIARAF